MIYFIECGEYIKIGLSVQPLIRLEALQTDNPIKLKLLACHPGGRSEELRLHKRFVKLRVRREWFQGDAKLRRFALKKKTKAENKEIEEFIASVNWIKLVKCIKILSSRRKQKRYNR